MREPARRSARDGRYASEARSIQCTSSTTITSGWRALADTLMRTSASRVRALTASEFRLLTRSQFDRLIKSESLAAYKVIAALAEVIAWRLGRMDEKFVELSHRAGGAAPAEEIAVFKHKLFTEWNL